MSAEIRAPLLAHPISGHVDPLKPLGQDPEPNLVADNFGNLMYALGAVTRKSGRHRTLSDRAIAKTLLQDIRDNRKVINSDQLTPGLRLSLVESNKRLFQELKDRGDIAEKYLNQGLVHVDMGKLGEISTPYVIIEPPEGRIDPRFANRPMVIIPGISNGLADAEALAKELAYQGRTVIVLAQPESYRGVVTPEFADVAEKSSSLEPHIEFFKVATRLVTQKWVKDGQLEIDLVGHSTGCAIIAGMLGDNDFQQMTANAFLISPAAVVEQSLQEFDNANIPELFHLATNSLNKIANVALNREPQTPLKARVTQAVKQNILHFQKDIYQNATIVGGGHLVIISGDQDKIVKSSQSENILREINHQFELVNLPDAAHAEAWVHPERVVEIITGFLR